MSNSIIVGRLGAAYGIKGWLHVISYTDPVENIFNYTDWHLNGRNGHIPVTLDTYKPHGKGYVIKLVGFDDREKAMQYKGTEILIDRNQLPETAEDEYYWSDLIGLAVMTTTGQS